MPLYTFYPNQPDGSSSAFQAIELTDDHAACDAAARMLTEYGSCVAVAIWQEDRRVTTVPLEARS